MKMKTPLLSIIVPAYNAEKTIGKLIDSIISQDYKDYELIIVNDGSKDKTLEIITDYSKKYNNIFIIDKPNTGRGDTRNKGMEIARGKYITFGDSDDYYCDNFFEVIIPEIEKEDFELLVFNANVINYDKITGNQISKKYHDEKFNNSEGVISYLKGNLSHRIANVPWNKIYVGKIIRDNNLKYNIYKKRGQDLIFNILYVSKINNYRYINKNLYNYNLNYNALSNNKYVKNSVDNLLEYYEPIKEICIENNIEKYERYMSLFFLRRFPGIVLDEVNNPSKKDGIANIKRFLENQNMKFILKKIKLSDLDFKLFIAYLLYKFRLYKIVYIIFRNLRKI